CETTPSCSETPQTTDLYLVTSPDGGATWTPPLQLNATTGSYFFPWVAAGSRGRLDIVYYRSPTLRPNDPSSEWFVGTTQVIGARAAVTSGRASFATAPSIHEELVTPAVEHTGGICTFGIFCSAIPNANRNLA